MHWVKSLFNKIAEPQPASLLEQRLSHRCFPRNFAKFLRTPLDDGFCKSFLVLIDYNFFYKQVPLSPPALKVAYIFKVFEAERCLTVVY